MSSTKSSHIFQVAQQDASHCDAAPVNLKDISEGTVLILFLKYFVFSHLCIAADARKLISEEHKALGYRPPPGSLASQAQALVARHETSHAEDHSLTLDEEQIRKAALLDAERIKKDRESTLLDLNSVGEGTYNRPLRPSSLWGAYIQIAEANKLVSDEHKALGYRPPPSSLAAEAHHHACESGIRRCHPYRI